MTGENELPAAAQDPPLIDSAEHQAAAGDEDKLILTKEALDKFYTLLDPDKEEAGRRELKLKERLNRYFSVRRCEDVEGLTDRTIHRVIRKLDKGAEIDNVEAFSLGIARYIHMEYIRDQEKWNTCSMGVLPDPVATGLNELEKLILEQERGIHNECLKQCLQRQKPHQRALILEYYDYDNTKPGDAARAHTKLANSLEVSQGDLIKRLYRIRAKLEKCVKKCVEKMT